MNANYKYRETDISSNFTNIIYPGMTLLLIIVASAFILASNSQHLVDPLSILNQSHQNLTSKDAYNYKTSEEGDNYILNFKGNHTRGEITGSIQEHKVSILVNNQIFYIKNNNNDTWEKAEDLELEKLSHFILDPAELLKIIISNENISATLINDDFEGILILIPFQAQTQNIINLLFPGISQDIIKDLNIHLWLDLNNFLEKIKIDMVVVANNNEKERITRVIELDYQIIQNLL